MAWRAHWGCVHLKPTVPLSAEIPAHVPLAARTTTAQQALDQFHDAHSPLGRVRRVAVPPVEAEPDVISEFDPFA